MNLAICLLSIAVITLVALCIYSNLDHIQIWWKGWSGPSLPIETFHDESPTKSDSRGIVGTGKEPDPLLELVKANKSEERLFWLEQEFGKFRTQLDQFHPLKAALEEQRGLLKKVIADVQVNAASNLWMATQKSLGEVENAVHKQDRQMDSISAELSRVIDSTKKFQATLENIIKTKVSEENYAPLKQTVGRQDTDINTLKTQVRKLESSTPFEVARLNEIVAEMRKDVTGTRTIVNALQGATYENLGPRVKLLEQNQTDEAKLFDAAKQSADIKRVANFEVREAIKGQFGDLRSNRDDLVQVLLKKLAIEFQDIADRRYVQIPAKSVSKKALQKAKAKGKS